MDNIKDFEVNSPRWLSLEDFEGEVWKPVVGYGKLFLISNYGRVKTTSRENNHFCQRILRQYCPKGRGCYWKVDLCFDGIIKRKFVHRLVAEAFLPTPQKLPEVNHKDENKKNPHLDNLEWCTRKYNANYGTMPQRMREHIKRRRRDGETIKNGGGGGMKHIQVHQYDLNGNYIATYNSQKEAGLKTGINSNNICDVCKGRALSAGGFIWTYTKEEDEITIKTNFAKGRKGKRRKRVLPIGKYTLDNKFVCLYDNASIAARDVGVHYSNIIRCAKGKHKQCAGFIWKYHTL